METLYCINCGKRRIKSIRGLHIHQRSCKHTKSNHRRNVAIEIIPEPNRDRRDRKGQSNYDSIPPLIPGRAQTIAIDRVLNLDLLDKSALELESIQGDLDSDFGENWDNISEHASISGATRASRIDTTNSVVVRTFEDETGNTAGTPIRKASPEELISLPKENEYWPFASESEYYWVEWALRTKLSRGAIEEYLKSPSMSGFRQDLTFRDFEGMTARIDKIPYGIRGDKWTEAEFHIDGKVAGGTPETLYLRYRDPQKVIEFLLGFPPFRPYLVYAPVKEFDDPDMTSRMYSEIHTADWWWETQTKLPNGATIVPLLISTDKTLMTQHQGDRSTWPVFLTIGNLHSTIRRSQTMPGMILLGELPIYKEVKRAKDSSSDGVKAHLYHQAMAKIFDRKSISTVFQVDNELTMSQIAIKELSHKGFNVVCADGFVRKFYPIIAGMMVDYEEQALITGIKSGQHCSICKVPPNERETLTRQWDKRTHEDTQAMLHHIRENHSIKTSEDDWIHDVPNFAWGHAHANLHSSMMIDILHQLLQGLFKHLIDWVKVIVSGLPRGPEMADEGGERSFGEMQLDERFRKMAEYPDLRLFKQFSAITQWTGEERQSILLQFIPAIAPLLLENHADQLSCARSIVDFIFVSTYKVHDDETIRYLSHFLSIIDLKKEAFRCIRQGDKESRGHFNFPKFHIISHYPEFIRRFGAACGVDTQHSEAGHRYHLKDFYTRTNKHKDYMNQIFKHNIRAHHMRAMGAMILAAKATRTSNGSGGIDTQVTSLSQQIELRKLGNNKPAQSKTCRQECHENGKNPKHWTTVAGLASLIEIPDLVDALAVFVRESRRPADQRDIVMADTRDKDPSWVNGWFVSIHPSLRCWKANGKDPKEPEKLTTELVRCGPWHSKAGKWRQDHVWVQEFSTDGINNYGDLPRKGQMVGQLQIILSIEDPERVDERGKRVIYTGALVHLLKAKSKGHPHEIHGMVEVTDWPTSHAVRPRLLGGWRFYNVKAIHRSAHIVPTGAPGQYYINNYIDWEQYNTIYDTDWMAKGMKQALAIRDRWINFEVKRKVEAEKRKAAVEKAQEIEEANRMEYEIWKQNRGRKRKKV
jgi:hypothetical protein